MQGEGCQGERAAHLGKVWGVRAVGWVRAPSSPAAGLPLQLWVGPVGTGHHPVHDTLRSWWSLSHSLCVLVDVGLEFVKELLCECPLRVSKLGNTVL